MTIQQRLNYYRRLFPAYLGRQKSQLTFWHDPPELNERFQPNKLGEYYMPFTAKADYCGQYDSAGIPLLDYQGNLGLQYNPIAIAQYGLGNYNSFHRRTGAPERRQRFLGVADWLVAHLEKNPMPASGCGITILTGSIAPVSKSPWYSALAQGQGISLLVRAHRETGQSAYLEAAQRAFLSFLNHVDEGGVVYVDENGFTWFEEYIVFPPTHILNGFIWATWGVYDYFLATGDPRAQRFVRSGDAYTRGEPSALRCWFLVTLRAIRHLAEDDG